MTTPTDAPTDFPEDVCQRCGRDPYSGDDGRHLEEPELADLGWQIAHPHLPIICPDCATPNDRAVSHIAFAATVLDGVALDAREGRPPDLELVDSARDYLRSTLSEYDDPLGRGWAERN